MGKPGRKNDGYYVGRQAFPYHSPSTQNVALVINQLRIATGWKSTYWSIKKVK
jgi:hypothetical protein